MFFGTSCELLYCNACQEQTNIIRGAFSIIYLPIVGFKDLIGSLDDYTEKKTSSRKISCSKCYESDVEELKRSTFCTLPPVLVIQLQRFNVLTNETVKKLDDFFEFPQELDIKSTWCPTHDSQCTLYELTGVVVHSGTPDSRHYLSYASYREPNGSKQWYEFGGSNFLRTVDMSSKVFEKIFFGGKPGKPNAYMLFYKTKLTDEIFPLIEMNGLHKYEGEEDT